MDSSRSKLDMSLDEIVKISHGKNRFTKQTKRLDQSRRHSFPNGQRMNHNGRRSYNNNNNLNNGGGFNKNNNLSNYNRSSLSNRSKGTVQIGNLSMDVNEDDLIQLFNTIGDVERVEIMYDSTGTSRGIAKVVFRQLQDAMDAVEKYNNVRLDGQPMKMHFIHEVQGGHQRQINQGQQRSQFNQNRRNDGNRFVRSYDSQRSAQNRNNNNGVNFRQNNNNRTFNRQQRHSTGNSNFNGNNSRRQFQNNNAKEVNQEDLDRDLEEFLASR